MPNYIDKPFADLFFGDVSVSEEQKFKEALNALQGIEPILMKYVATATGEDKKYAARQLSNLRAALSGKSPGKSKKGGRRGSTY